MQHASCPAVALQSRLCTPAQHCQGGQLLPVMYWGVLRQDCSPTHLLQGACAVVGLVELRCGTQAALGAPQLRVMLAGAVRW